jgi:serine O-acetyltransferase
MTDLTFARPGLDPSLKADLFTPNQGAANCNPAGIGFWALVAEDLRTHDGDLLAQGFWALFWHRFGNWRMGVRPKLLRAPLTLIYRFMFKLCEWWGGIRLPYTVRVGRRVRLDHFGGMVLVAQSIGNDVTIRQNTTFGIATPDRLHDRPVIGDGVEIGAGAVIVGSVGVGAEAVIGANAVVTRHVPPGAVMGGVPARILKRRDCSPGVIPVSLAANSRHSPETQAGDTDGAAQTIPEPDRRRRHRTQ